jgi:diguanylate cyclase (GGDEF)-like protein
MGGLTVNTILSVVLTLFLIAQNATYYLAYVFIDYFAHHNPPRTKKILKFLAVFFILFIAAVILNLKQPFFFYFSADNHYTPAFLYPLRLGISYFSMVLIIINIFSAAKHFKVSQIYLLSLFCLLTALGAAMDIIFRNGSLLWPCFAAGVLYIYFFIVQSDSKIDSLTGIGNRLSFNEFIDKLSRSSSKESYSIVMLDMDHFKEINDTLGHLEGDNALRDMAAIIKSCIRHTDFAARYGGDEFVLAALAEYDITRLMDRIAQAMDNQNKLGKRPYKLLMSYGHDIYSARDKRTITEFLSHIDGLMYQNKMENRKKEQEAKQAPC